MKHWLWGAGLILLMVGTARAELHCNESGMCWGDDIEAHNYHYCTIINGVCAEVPPSAELIGQWMAKQEPPLMGFNTGPAPAGECTEINTELVAAGHDSQHLYVCYQP